MSYKKSAGFSKANVVVLLLVGLLVAAAAGAYFLGYVYAGVKVPSQRAQLVSNVCDQRIVDTYNSAFNDIATQPAKLADLEKTITSRGDYDKDSTCVYILAQKSLSSGNTIAAGKFLSLLKANVARGAYVNSNLRGVASVEQLEISITVYQAGSVNTPQGEG